MTAREAFKYAMKKSPEFVDGINRFKADNEHDGIAGCFVYSIGDQAYSYAWCECDGYSHYKISSSRSRYLIRTKHTLVIE